MGLLDDAIREHLDLKRRRGADPTEVERAEREVLGPVRPRVQASGDEFALEDDLEYEPIADDGDPWDDREPEATADLEPPPPSRRFEPEALAPPEPERFAPREPERFAPPEPEPAAYTGFPSEPEPYRADPLPDPSDQDPSTVEYNIEEELELEEEGGFEEKRAFEEKVPPLEGEEDVLEETPDFLQDTPDHDRLWFEQRPPRDFDFDG
jgi:hypothetical protein